MHKIEIFMKEHYGIVNLVLFALALVTGGASMAIMTNGEPDATSIDDSNAAADLDPADPSVNDRYTPGDGTAGQDLTGTQASSSQLRRGGLIDEEWDNNLTKFQPWRNPMLSIARQVSRKQQVSNWEIKHGRVGGDTLDGTTTADIEAATKITLTADNFSGSLKPFYKGSTILVPSVGGYKRGTSDTIEGGLMLFVTESNGKDEVTCMAVNGPLRDGYDVTEDLDCMSCPAIPAGTYLCAGATAASESQLVISPENFQPREEVIFLQKKLLNIVFTEDFEKVKTRQPVKVKDIKEDAIYKYNMRAERTYWYGAMSRFSVTHTDGSVEDVHTSKGILWQVTNTYSIATSGITVNDLIAISKLQHTTFSQSDHSYGFCGRNFMERLLKIDLGENTTKIINVNDIHQFDLDFKRLKTTFGTTDFIYDQGLDMLGLDDVCVVLDLEGATRYVKISEKERTNDMSKGAGEIRDAKRIIHEEADCIALRGYNSIFIAPESIAFGLPDTQIRSNVVASSVLPDSAASGTIVALTDDYELDGTTYEAGSVYTYDGLSWSEYTGYTTVV